MLRSSPHDKELSGPQCQKWAASVGRVVLKVGTEPRSVWLIRCTAFWTVFNKHRASRGSPHGRGSRVWVRMGMEVEGRGLAPVPPRNLPSGGGGKTRRLALHLWCALHFVSRAPPPFSSTKNLLLMFAPLSPPCPRWHKASAVADVGFETRGHHVVRTGFCVDGLWFCSIHKCHRAFR